MERARIRRRRQQFQAQFEVCSRELRDALAAQLTDGAHSAALHTRLVLKMQYQIGELCAEYNEFSLASVYFQQVLTSLGPAAEEAEEMAPLRGNTLNWLAVVQFRAGNQHEAMDYLLQAKKCSRDENAATESSNSPVDKSLTVNYALFLHAKGNIADAEHAAQFVVNDDIEDPSEESDDDTKARSTAFMLLASIFKARGYSERARTYAERAVSLADRVRDPRLISRAHNNLGIYCLEQGQVERAFSLFAGAYRATQQTKDFEQQATVKYHLGLALSYLGRNQDLSDNEEEDESTQEIHQKQQPRLPDSAEDEAAAETSAPALPPAKTPKNLFLESENLSAALSEPDNILRVLTQTCQGEEEYYAGEFHTAEAEFSIAMGQFKDFTGIDIDEDPSTDAKPQTATGTQVTEEEQSFILPPIEPEYAKLQGHLLSYIGCTQLVEGKFTFAEHSHKRDLALALRQEDLHAQHRALRNLAIVYNATQRYVEAIPVWREVLELSVVLNLNGEQLMAYSGLGSALRELLMLEGPGAIEAAGLNSDSMHPLQVFMKQCELAQETGDLHQQILAQRHIVSVYESPISKPQSESEATEVLERRLSESDTLVRLCEKYENLQYRADAYRSLANALTSQIVRLRSRANGTTPHHGLAEAIAMLSQKRNSVCTSFQKANASLSSAAALFQDAYEEGHDDASKPKPEERQARPPLTRLEILHCR